MRARACAAVALSLCAGLLATGCGRAAPPPKTSAEGAVAARAPAVLDEAGLASALPKLLSDAGPSVDRSTRLGDVVATQLGRAKGMFAAQKRDAGLAAVSGALALVKVGELRAEMLAGNDGALADAQAEAARTGDEGRTLGLLALRSSSTAAGSAERREVDLHREALQSWLRETSKGGVIEPLGRTERVAMAELLVAPTPESQGRARDAALAWIERAIALHQGAELMPGRRRREDAVEAFRALRSGVATLAALHLRDGDAAGALAELDKFPLPQLVSPRLRTILQRATNDVEPHAWIELAEYLRDFPRSDHAGHEAFDEDPELSLEPALQRAALFGVAIEAWRRNGDSRGAGEALAALLAERGFPAVGPALTARATGP